MTKQLTNNQGMPQIMVDVIQEDDYVNIGASEYSATNLIMPPRMLQLVRRHKDKIEEDVMDRWYMWMGNAVHEKIDRELKSNKDYATERKITRFDEGRRVVAKFDAYHIPSQTLFDHKTTTTYIHGSEMKDEWINQLNINAFFLEEEGFPVQDIAINAIYLDWRSSWLKYKRDGDYPLLPVGEFRIEAWPQERRKEYYLDRLKQHIAAEQLEDDKLPECTSEDTWEKPSSFAVRKSGAYSAKRVLPSYEEAEKYIAENKLKDGYYIEVRPGERTRCANYCSAAPFCKQYQDWLNEPAKEYDGE